MLMKEYRKVFLLFVLAILIFLIYGCKKEESEQGKKEALIYKMTGDIQADSLEANVKWLQNMGTRFALADGHRQIAVKIKNRYIGMGYTDTRIDSFEITKVYKDVTYTQWQYNVVATLRAGTNSDSICIIGAHYDDILNTGDPFTGAPGANDNASGTAAAMEIARVMTENNFVPANTIKFIAFGSEELGLFGSWAYANFASQHDLGIKFMLNNDMIAYEPDNDKANWKVNILDYDNSHTLRREAEILCNKYTILTSYNDNTYHNATDSYPFFASGYKALFFFSDVFDPDYHSTGDIASHCNFEYCREIVKLNCAILIDNN
jgi:hypothetical protein